MKTFVMEPISKTVSRIDRLSVLRGLAVRDDAPAGRIDDADDDADALMLHVDAVGEDGADIGVGQRPPRALHGRETRDSERLRCA